MNARTISANPVGTATSRLIISLALGDGSMTSALAKAEAYRDSPEVGLTIKAAIEAMSSGSSSATALAAYGLHHEFLTLLNPMTVFGRARERMRRLPFRSKAPRELTAAGGAWIGRGAPIPVTNTEVNTLQLERYEAGVIAILSRELLRAGGPAAEGAARMIVLAGVAAYLDRQFLEPSEGPVSETQPGSITYDAPSKSSTGTTAESLMADLADVAAMVGTDFGAPAWIMRPRVAKALAAKVTTSGDRAFPNINLQTGGTINGTPVLLSRNVPMASGSPSANLIVLADLSEVTYADDEEISIDVADAGGLAMSDFPAAPSSQVSLFQTNSVGIRVVRGVSWQRTRNDAVAYLDDLGIV
jgi:HK97 family phage major capsid protein